METAADIIEKYDISLVENDYTCDIEEHKWYFPTDNDPYSVAYQMLRMASTLCDLCRLFNVKVNVFESRGEKTTICCQIKVHSSGNKYTITDWKGWYIRIEGKIDTITQEDAAKIDRFLTDIDEHDGCLVDKHCDEKDDVDYCQKQLISSLNSQYDKKYTRDIKRKIKKSIMKKYGIKIVEEAIYPMKKESAVHIYNIDDVSNDLCEIHKDIVTMCDKLNFLDYIYDVRSLNHHVIDTGDRLSYKMYMRVGNDTYIAECEEICTVIQYNRNKSLDIVKRFISDISMLKCNFIESDDFISGLVPDEKDKDDSEEEED